eukprot:s73_g29.t1
MTYDEYLDAMASYEPGPDSDMGDLNPDDYLDMRDAQDIMFQSTDFAQVERDTEQFWREIGRPPQNEDGAEHVSLSPCEGNQKQGEDLRTSRAPLKPKEHDKICAAPQQEKGQEQGEDLRTSRTDEAVGSKEYGEETQGLQEPKRPPVGLDFLNTLAEPAPVGTFCPICGSSAMVSKHECLKRSKSMPALRSSQTKTEASEAAVLTASCNAPSGNDSVQEGHQDGFTQLYRAPQLLMQYSQEPCLVIVDTGCQRQVAGRMWHNPHHAHLDLPRLTFSEKCQFRFGA